MKKALFSFAVLALLAVSGAKAQVRYVYDPFKNGDKSIGLEAGLGVWFGSSNFKLDIDPFYTESPYFGYAADKYKRSPLNPTVSLVYKRVIEGRRVCWGNNFRLTVSLWHGTVEGASTTNPANTFTTSFNYKTFELSEHYYAMIPINDQLFVNAGLGLSVGTVFGTRSTIEYSNGSESVNTKGGTDFLDLLTGLFDVLVGVDYRINDDFTLSCNLTGHPVDFFGLFDDDGKKGLRGVGEGLFVSKQFPCQLTFGFTYSL